MECDPCKLCGHYCEAYDRHTGYTDVGCDADVEFAIEDVRPCPYFKPILPSEGLLEQLYYEQEMKEYLEDSE